MFNILFAAIMLVAGFSLLPQNKITTTIAEESTTQEKSLLDYISISQANHTFSSSDLLKTTFHEIEYDSIFTNKTITIQYFKSTEWLQY